VSVFALLVAACGPSTPPENTDSGTDIEADAGDVDDDVADEDTSDASDASDTSDTSDSEGDTSDTEEDADACTPRTTCEDMECGDVDDGCGGTIDCGECPECTAPTDCTAGDNVDPSCEAGACEYACATGFVDINGDLGTDGNGCECEVTNGGTEICDGLDNDCDGTVDQNPEPQDCALTAGVCASVQTSTCDSGDYVACVPSDYGSDYVDAADEDYRCDGLDNDCDGLADNPCCGSGSNPLFPAPSIVGDSIEPSSTNYPYDTQVEPAIAPAAQNAPPTAVAAVAYLSASDVVTITHVTADGNPVGTAYTRTENDFYTGIELVKTHKGYDLIFARTVREGTSGVAGFWAIEVQQLTPMLSEDGSDAQLVYDNNDTLASLFRDLDASYKDRSVVVAATSYSGFNELARAYFYRIDSIGSTAKEITIDGDGKGTGPRSVRHGTGHLLVSIDEDDNRMYGMAVDTSGNPSGSFQHSPSPTEYDVYLAWLGGNEVAAVYEESGALSTATLNFSSPSSPSPSQINSGDALGEFIAGTDWDDDQDGDAESTTLIWRDAGGSQLEAAEFDLQTGTLVDGPHAILDGAGAIDEVSLINDGKQAFVVFQDRSSSRVKFFRMSRSGVALCD
jgi:hypothetical protein